MIQAYRYLLFIGKQDLTIKPYLLFFKMFEKYAGLADKLKRKLVGIRMNVNDTLYARIDNHFRAYRTRLMSDVNSCAVNAYALFCGLNNCVLFGVNGIAQLLTSTRFNAPFVAHTYALIAAIKHTRRRAVITRRQNSLVLNNDGSDLSAVAMTARPA